MPTFLCAFAVRCLFKDICTFIFRICLIIQIIKHRRLIYCREKLDHLVKRKLRVFVCREQGLTIFYGLQAPMKRVWNPLFPQIDITEHCNSLCKRQISLKTAWTNLGVAQNEYNHFFGYIFINPSRDLVVSLACHSYSSRSGKKGSSPLRVTISMEISPHGFCEIFRI